MFDDLDFEASPEMDARRAELIKTHGPDEAEMILMREASIAGSVKKNAKQLDKNAADTGQLSDNNSLLDNIGDEFKEEVIEEETITEEVIENEVIEEEVVETEDDVESESETPKMNDVWVKEKEEITKTMQLQDGLLRKMHAELEDFKKKAIEAEASKVKEPVVEAKPRISKEEINKKAKEVVSKMSYAEEDGASDVLTELMMSIMGEDKPQVVKEDLSESKLDELLEKREQKKYAQKFEKERDSFFASEEGKKVLADEDLLDLFTVKFNRLQNSGEHLNPEDLFKKAWEKTQPVKASSSTAKPVPRIATSLKDDVNKSEEAKKQAVKPTGSSNAVKAVESKKFDPIAYYNEMLKQTSGQSI